MKQTENIPVVEAIAEKIQNLIQKEGLIQGDKLPPERTLSELFKVSRSSVREAIRSLAQQEIVESRRGDGTYICVPMQDSTLLAFSLAFSKQKKRMHEIFEFRRALEPQIAAAAAAKCSPEHLKRLKIIICDQERELKAGNDVRDLDIKFHQTIAEASGNTFFIATMKVLNPEMTETRSTSLINPERLKKSLSYHYKLLDALEERDSNAARKLMEEHLTCAEETSLAESISLNPSTSFLEKDQK